MVNQVTVIGILMIVNGSLQVLMGILYAIVGPVFLNFFTRDVVGPAAPPQAQQVQQVFTFVSIIYVVLGSIVALCGCMNIAGGISALRYRSRTFVITALFFNILPLITCYCLPTSLGLMIWGLIVMFQSDVAYAFTLGASGYSVEEIKQRMGVGAYRRGGERYDEDRRGEDRGDDWDARGAEPKPPQPPPKGPPGEEHIYGADEAPKEKRDIPPSKAGPSDEQFFEK